MNGMQTLEDLFRKQISEMFFAENQIAGALPRMMREVSSEELKEALGQQLEEAKEQSRRIEQFLGESGELPRRGGRSEVVEILLRDADKLLSTGGDPGARDAAIICTLQKIKHYEIAAYGCLRTYGSLLGYEEIAGFLAQSLDEEKNADALLTGIAQGKVNVSAISLHAT